MAKLIVTDGPDTGCEYDLAAGPEAASFTVGRDPRAEVPLSDTAVSRRHFAIERTPRSWRLVDLGSRNQTFLNGEPIKERFLTDGDTLRAGDTVMRFENPGEPLDAGNAASTIIKELPPDRTRDTFLERLVNLESSLEEHREGKKPTGAREAMSRLRKVIEAYGAMTATSSAVELFARLLTEGMPALRAERGAVILKDASGWMVKAAHPADGPTGVSASTTIFDKALVEGKAVLSAAAAGEGPLDADGRAPAGARSMVAAPILLRGRPAGVLYAERGEPSPPFREEELELLVALADPVGALLERMEVEESLRSENLNLYRSLTESKRIVGRSPATLEILEFIRRAAPTPMTVLIQGETGTGKELVASAIHYSSPRRGRPFVAINCAALPENLAESELFGHERGAFTGAVTRRKGKFELGDSGTVFLDEVGELTLTCQAKLLRLLEERQFERVGGVDCVKVDVRVIAATNKDLLASVGEGTFREDLYYRLSVLNVRLPPLRERPEDIPLLAEHFLERCGTPRKLSKAAEKKLAAYSWPGNIRQLRNVIESAVVLGTSPEIVTGDLVLPPPRGGAKGAAAWEPITLEALTEQHVLRVLEHTGGNKKRAAELLGIERCTLYAKLKSYGIQETGE